MLAFTGVAELITELATLRDGRLAERTTEGNTPRDGSDGSDDRFSELSSELNLLHDGHDGRISELSAEINSLRDGSDGRISELSAEINSLRDGGDNPPQSI